MSTVTMHRCDQCGKLAEAEGEAPKGWRKFALPFAGGTGTPLAQEFELVVEACSPGCAKRLLGDNVDGEWDVHEADHVVMSQADFDAITSATRNAA